MTAVSERVALHPSFGAPAGRPRSVVFFGKNRARTRASSGFVEGFRAHGLRVRWFRFGRLKRIVGRSRALDVARRMLRRERPDLVFAIHPDLPPELFDAIGELRAQRPGMRVAQWCDMPMREPSEATVRSFVASDAVFLTNPARIPWFVERGAVRLVPALEGFSPRHHFRAPGAARRGPGLVFIGGPSNRPERAGFLRELGEHLPVDVFGKGWEAVAAEHPRGLRFHPPVKPPAFRRLCRDAGIVLGFNEVNDDPYYFSDRTVLSLACGAFHLTHRIPGLDEVYTDGEHLACYDGVRDCIDRIEYHQGHPELRARIAAAGHDLVHARHRLLDRVSFILDTLEHAAFAPMLPGHAAWGRIAATAASRAPVTESAVGPATGQPIGEGVR